MDVGGGSPSPYSLPRGDAEQRCPSAPAVWTWLTGYHVAVLCLAGYVLMTVTALRQQSATFDEPAHLAIGYSHLVSADYRLAPANGPLPERLAALPLLVTGPKFPDLDQPPLRGADAYAVGRAFLYQPGRDAEGILFRCRIMMALLAGALGLVIYAWSRELCGPGAGLISVLLFCFCPNFLAHGGLVASDVALAAGLTLALWRFWKLLNEVSWWNLSAASLACGVLVLGKMSWVLFLPMLAALFVLRLVAGGPLLVRLRGCFIKTRFSPANSHDEARGRDASHEPRATSHEPRAGDDGGTEVTSRARQAGILLAACVVLAAAAFLAIWACFGFRYAAFGSPGVGFLWQEYLQQSGPVRAALDVAREFRLLPENYLFTFAHVAQSVEQRQAFLNGAYSATGWWYFFPYAVLVKTTLATWLLVLLAVLASRGGLKARVPRAPREALWYRAAPLWVLLVIYSASAMAGHLNLGVRHALPLYPPLFILAGACARSFARPGWMPRLLVVLGLGLHAGESLAVRPHYLAYFNALAGGPRHGYRHLVDSSLDWGQDLPGLQRWLAEHAGTGEAHVAYFGTASLDYYGIKARRLPGFLDQRARLDPSPWKGGLFAISATLLQGLCSPYPGPWLQAYEERYQAVRPAVAAFVAAAPAAQVQRVKDLGAAHWRELFSEYDWLRFGRLREWLRGREPDAQIGYSVLIYRLTDEDLRAALEGSPRL